MSDDDKRNGKTPEWLEEFERFANQHLQGGSSCKQVHPIIERWYRQVMDSEPPETRDSVMQAIACLSTEIITDMPEDIFDAIFSSDIEQVTLSQWVQEILMLGRVLQMALEKGDLDDL
jgi:hypothetical protein